MTPLHSIGELIRAILLQIPLPVVRGLFLALPVLLLIWVLRLPATQTRPPAPATPGPGKPALSGRWDEDLKLWASLALLVQIVIYALI